MKRDTDDNRKVPVSRDAKGGQAFPRDQVPDTDVAVGATGGKEGAVKVQGQSTDGSSVPTKRRSATSRGKMPELNRAIVTAGGKRPATRRHSNIVHASRVSLERNNNEAIVKKLASSY